MRCSAHIVACSAFAVSIFADVASAADRELGKYLSEECITCHRPNAASAAGVPPIAGLPEDQFVALMESYRDKVRDNPVMQTVAGKLSADDVAALAAYFGSVKPAKKAKK